MSERFAADTVFILVVMLVAALLGFIIGYLLRKYKITSLEADLEVCRESKLSDNSSLKTASVPTEPIKISGYDADTAKEFFGKKIKEDDLTLVEGIGPKIAALMQEAGFTTWAKMGAASIEELQTVIDNAGERFSLHKADSWPMQAELAAQGRWEELKKLQDKLDGGRISS